MRFERMTWPEIAEIDWTNATVLLPVGAIEQHGPHLPVDTDTRIVTAFAQAVEAALPERVVLTPTVWLGHSPHHLSFGGTLSLYHPAYIEMIVGVCRSYIGMGARRIWIMNGHGGNRMPLSVVLQQLKNEFPETKVAAAEYWNVARDEIAAVRESGFGGLGHACELETSLYWHLCADGVRKDRIRDDGVQAEGESFRTDMLAGASVARVFDFDELTESGVFGQPSLASAEKGRRFFDAVAGRLVAFAEEWLAVGR